MIREIKTTLVFLDESYVDSQEGVCISCGAENECVPNARNCKCSSCGEHKVFGGIDVTAIAHINAALDELCLPSNPTIFLLDSHFTD